MMDETPPPRAGRRMLPFQVFYRIAGDTADRDQVVYGFDADHAKRVFTQWAIHTFPVNVEIMEIR